MYLFTQLKEIWKLFIAIVLFRVPLQLLGMRGMWFGGGSGVKELTWIP